MVDTRDLKSLGRGPVQVRVLFRAVISYVSRGWRDVALSCGAF